MKPPQIFPDHVVCLSVHLKKVVCHCVQVSQCRSDSTRIGREMQTISELPGTTEIELTGANNLRVSVLAH